MNITWNIIFLVGAVAFGIIAIVNAVRGQLPDAERRATLSLAFLVAYFVAPH